MHLRDLLFTICREEMAGRRIFHPAIGRCTANVIRKKPDWPAIDAGFVCADPPVGVWKISF